MKPHKEHQLLIKNACFENDLSSLKNLLALGGTLRAKDYIHLIKNNQVDMLRYVLSLKSKLPTCAQELLVECVQTQNTDLVKMLVPYVRYQSVFKEGMLKTLENLTMFSLLCASAKHSTCASVLLEVVTNGLKFEKHNIQLLLEKCAEPQQTQTAMDFILSLTIVHDNPTVAELVLPYNSQLSVFQSLRTIAQSGRYHLFSIFWDSVEDKMPSNPKNSIAAIVLGYDALPCVKTVFDPNYSEKVLEYVNINAMPVVRSNQSVRLFQEMHDAYWLKHRLNNALEDCSENNEETVKQSGNLQLVESSVSKKRKM